MLLKILITLAVILIVALIFRVKQPQNKATQHRAESTQKDRGSSNLVIYSLLGVIIAISTLIFVLNWNEQHRIINVRVTNNQGDIINYQAYQKDIEGRRFITLDGVSVTLGISDRIEMVE
ncbi:MAG: hypothetical protein CL402_11035 [Acidiferrobacteraceae bacterium]|nr:hypothetical protein [Acidiferrobacteraceae bacterium]|tara:strand:+ start:12416 stop:12775 length:360 start_codon:yes stop_codon:yes gene_type:complete